MGLAYKTGTVTNFAGGVNTGLLQTVLDFILGTEVTGETLSGSGTSWSGTLANSPVGLGRLLVDYEFSSTAYQAVDDGSGNIVGTNITSGTITYSTGAYSITFSGTPDAAPTADYIYGEEGQDWRLELNRTTRDNGGGGYTEPCAGCIETVFSNTGLSGQEQIIVGVRECNYPSEDFYAWNLNGYTTFSDAGEWDQNDVWHGLNTYHATWNTFQEHPSVPLIDDTMTYWIYSNQQRVIIVAKTASNYEPIHLGFGRRFGNPGDYPFPLLIGGSSCSTRINSDATSYHLFFVAGGAANGQYHSWIFAPGTVLITWMGLASSLNGQRVIPYDTWNSQGALDPTRDGRHMMTPVYYTAAKLQNSHNFFDLDGVYHIAGTGLQSEDLVNYNSRRYRVFQNIYRTTYYDYMAIEEGSAVSTTTTTTTTTV